MQKVLVIQTAFIGDAILASALVETINKRLPDADVHLLVRKGNEGLFVKHPFLKKVWVWNKKEGKYKTLLALIKQVRSEKFDAVVNLQRFGATGLLTAFSGGQTTIGFRKNPFSFLFTHKMPHVWGDNTHEIERNVNLLEPLLNQTVKTEKPRLYPTDADKQHIQTYLGKPFVCMAPTSVWFTKQYPAEKWVELCNKQELVDFTIYLLGAPSDAEACKQIIQKSEHPSMVNLCGKLNLLQSAALMQQANMNYVNDSAPMHLCSSVDAPVTAIYCSTVPSFGFGPLASKSFVVQTSENLDCRPCGMHGFKSCPKGHFKCGLGIDTNQLVNTLSQ